MTLTQALTYFKDASNLARQLKVSPQAVYQWESIPAHHQWTIALLSNFVLVPDTGILPDDFDQSILERGNYIQNESVSRLLSIANQLSKNGRDDIIEAMIVLAGGIDAAQ